MLPARPAPIRATTPMMTTHRSILSVLDVPADDFEQLCQRAVRLEHAASTPRSLDRRTVGVLFRNASTRTWTSFLAAAGRLGANVVRLEPDDLQTTTGETIDDTARVLAQYLDVLVMRTNGSVDEMKAFAAGGRLSVINALSADEHPTQAIADLATLLNHFGRFNGLSVVYCGEGNKTAAALALATSRLAGVRLTLATPAGYGLPAEIAATARALAATHGAAIEEVHDLAAVQGVVDAVYTSRWQEMGVDKPDPHWRRAFEPFRVTRALMQRLSGPSTVFLHDLPAVRGEDVEGEVIDGPQSLAWTQARYKLFAAMATLEWCCTRVPHVAAIDSHRSALAAGH